MASKEVNDIEVARSAEPRDGTGNIEISKSTLDHSKGDIALAFLDTSGEAVEIDPQIRARVLRKIDWHILPLLCLTTLLQFLDKSTLSYASIFGIITDTHLVGNEFSWLGSIFYFGYLGMQPIAAVLLQRFTPAKCLSFSVFLWGFILFMHVLCDTYAKLMVIRFILGAAEAIVTPAFILISSGWYSREDQPLRMGIWFSFNGVASVVGGILAYGIGHIEVNNIASWKWMFLLTAAISIVWSVLLFFTLPDSQLTARFFNEEEKRVAVEMVRNNNTGIHSKVFKKEQMVEALLDVKAWAFFFLAFVWNIPNSITTFGSLIVSNFGFSTLATTLLGMPAGGFEFFLMLIITGVCITRPNARSICIVVAVAIALVGTIMVFAAPYDNKAALLAGYYMVTVNAMTMIGYCVGNISGPQFYKSDQKPRYRLGIGSNMVSFIVIIVTIISLQLYLRLQNKRRAAMRDTSMQYGTETNLEFLDLTDKENPHFVYAF